MDTKQILDSVFEGHNLTTAVWNGKIVWLAAEISLALGYKNSFKISNLIRQEWASEFIENEHFIVKRSANEMGFDKPYYGSSKVRQAMLITEPGVDLVILKTRKPAGKRLRYHLSSVVLPQFRRGMIEERPVEELEARYKEEIYALKDKLIERDEQVISFAERLSKAQSELADVNYQLGAMGEAKASVCRAASLAGKALRTHRGTKKIRDMN